MQRQPNEGITGKCQKAELAGPLVWFAKNCWPELGDHIKTNPLTRADLALVQGQLLQILMVALAALMFYSLHVAEFNKIACQRSIF